MGSIAHKKFQSRPELKGPSQEHSGPWLRLTIAWIACALMLACGGSGAGSRSTSGSGTGSGSGSGSGQGILPQYFGMDIFLNVLPPNPAAPWPSFSFGSLRLWDDGTNWQDTNTADGVYNFSKLDAWLQIAQQHGITDILYTFGKTPSWASSNPNDQSCVDASSLAGSCDPPNDLNSDGSGTDQHWKDFVTAIVNRSANSPNAHITAWDIWNEPSLPKKWTGTMAQMVRMAKDASAIIKATDPSAIVTTPSPVNGSSGIMAAQWMSQYLAAGGSSYADVVAFHGYLSSNGVNSPENISIVVQQVSATKVGAGLSTKPLWDTESDWGRNSDLPDPDEEAAFLARFYLVQWSNGVSRLYWYQYGNTGFGSLWLPGSGPNAAATAYGTVYSWMVGATLQSPCSSTGSIWTCNFTEPGNVAAQAVWDASQNCSNGGCTTSTYTPSSSFTTYQDLTGVATPISPGSTLEIGARPVLLKSQ